MSDCIATNRISRGVSFAEKLHILASSHNTFYAMFGNAYVSECVQYLDYWFSTQGITNDFCTGNSSMKALAAFIEQDLLRHHSREEVDISGPVRLFFIDNENVVCYDLTYDSHNSLMSLPSFNRVPKDSYLRSYVNEHPQAITVALATASDVEVFCKNQIKYMSSSAGIDFKDRYSFVLINDGQVEVKNQPFKHLSDITAMRYGLDYNRLDDEEFKFNL